MFAIECVFVGAGYSISLVTFVVYIQNKLN